MALTTLPAKAIGDDSDPFSSLCRPNGEGETLRGGVDPSPAMFPKQVQLAGYKWQELKEDGWYRVNQA